MDIVTYKYNLSKHSVDEQPTMKYPTINGGIAPNGILERYHEYIASLRSIPIPSDIKVDWKEGENVTGKFREQYQHDVQSFIAMPIKGGYTWIRGQALDGFYKADPNRPINIQEQPMKIQKLKISEQDRQVISSFMGEEIPNEIDFNCLIEVIKKLNGGRPHSAMLWEGITKALIDCDIERTWLAVVEYIRWFYKR